MAKKEFRPDDWKPKRQTRSEPGCRGSGETWERAEDVVKRIEALRVDITADYKDWLGVGFALASEFGESGRALYHRVSVFYAGYKERETDKQYNSCLKSNGNGVTIATFFELAKRAGVSITKFEKADSRYYVRPKKPIARSAKQLEQTDDEEEEESMTIVRELKTDLPPLLKTVVSYAHSDADADLLMLGTIAVVSACMPHVSGVYFTRKQYPNLFLFVSAPAASGKGRLGLCRRLVDPIHREKKTLSDQEWKVYKTQMDAYRSSQMKDGIEPPVEPPQRMLIIPGNASATSMFQILSENDERGLIFETEGDTLAQTFKTEHGNYSDGFRKAFEHEPISYVRRKNREHVEVREPRLSAVLSGTPRQVSALIPDSENGLFSRFLYYTMPIESEWKDVFADSDDNNMDVQFQILGSKLLKLYHFLEQTQDMKFKLTKEQGIHFNVLFKGILEEYKLTYDHAMDSYVKRLAAMTFRMAMVLTVMRMMEGPAYVPVLECCDDDYMTCVSVAQKILLHAEKVFVQLEPATAISIKNTIALEIVEGLPETFTRKQFIEACESRGIREPTAKRYITNLKQSETIAKVACATFKRLR